VDELIIEAAGVGVGDGQINHHDLIFVMVLSKIETFNL